MFGRINLLWPMACVVYFANEPLVIAFVQLHASGNVMVKQLKE
jgi:hypothetical protein